jgi:hypothetical protein
VKECEHTVLLLGNRNLGSRHGVCAECATMVEVDFTDPEWFCVFAVVRRPTMARGGKGHD